MFYAELDERDVVIAILQPPEGVDPAEEFGERENMISITRYDLSLLGCMYKRDTGEFIPGTTENASPLPNPIEQLQNDQNALMLGLMDLYSTQVQNEQDRQQAMDAIMMGMMDIYAQMEELKSKIGGNA